MSSVNNKTSRTDIQALRGLAVLLVVFYHAKIGSLEAGYLGVDIFFVISGFLITTLIASELMHGQFKLSNFYYRRAKRLLPAAYITFFITVLLSPWFLNQQELVDLASQVIGALTFTGNIILWQQTGYFHGAGDLKPLLHIWSLAIEEQYYFLLPTALLFTKQSRWLLGAIILVLISFGLCIIGGWWKPIATFYLLPTRAWELLMGSVGALWLLRTSPSERIFGTTVVSALFAPALLCLAVIPVIPFPGSHPGINAFVICVATLVVILKNSPRLNSLSFTKYLASIGDISYSLYLVHWPIFALLQNAWLGSSPVLPINIRLMALTLSLILAHFLYRFVEDPIRRSNIKISAKLLVLIFISSITLALFTPFLIKTQDDYQTFQKPNFGLSEACEYQTSFVQKPDCQSKNNPSLLIWGDSFAMHLVSGLVQDWSSEGVIQATRSQCAPFLGLAHRKVRQSEVGPVIDLAWAKSCIEFNQSVFDFLRSSPAITTVVLSSPFTPYFTSPGFEHVVQLGDKFEPRPVSAEAARSRMHSTIKQIRSIGKKVILIAPPPSTGFNIGACLERQMSGKIVLGRATGCNLDRLAYQSKQAAEIDFLNQVSFEADVSVISFEPWLCDTDVCRTKLDGTLIYRDAGHLSVAGSRLLAQRMQIARLIREKAR